MRFRTFALLLLAPLVSAQESLFQLAPEPRHPTDRTRIEVTALFSMPAPGGFLPVRVTGANQRETDGTLNLRAVSVTGAGSEMSSSFEIDLPAGGTVTRDLLVPLNTALLSGSEIDASVSVISSGSFGRLEGGLEGEWSPTMPAVLLSEALFTPNRGELDKELNTSSSGYRTYSFAASFDPKRMPADWRAYAGYDLLMLTDADWLDLSPPARAAILEWCRLGADLEILRVGGSPATFASLGIEVDEGQSKRTYGFGSVSLGDVPADLKLDAPTVVTRLRSHSDSRLLSLEKDYSSVWPLHVRFGSRAFNYALFIVVLIAFGVVVGPVNLFVFAKSGRRHRLFITTPIISLATCALLLGLILMRDGIGGRGERVALIEVRAGGDENRAYVHQEQVSRTGVLLGSSFTVNEEAVIAPVPIADGPWTRLKSGMGAEDFVYTTAFTDEGLRLGGDWFSSRSEQGQVVEAIVPTRGRIEVREQNGTGAPKLVSSFDFPLETLYYTDRSGAHWIARNLEAGKPVEAVTIDAKTRTTALAETSDLFGARHRRMLQQVAPRSDHFIAITTEAPAIETFPSIRWQSTTTVLTGPVAR